MDSRSLKNKLEFIENKCYKDSLYQLQLLLKTMPQLSKVIRSRNDWRSKAILRANQIREHRKTHKQNREQIAEFKRQLKGLQQVAEDKKNI
jgi:hypothetical protein